MKHNFLTSPKQFTVNQPMFWMFPYLKALKSLFPQMWFAIKERERKFEYIQ